VGEPGFGEPDDLGRRLVAHDVEVMLQRGVSGPLEVDQLGLLVHPDLRAGGALRRNQNHGEVRLVP